MSSSTVATWQLKLRLLARRRVFTLLLAAGLAIIYMTKILFYSEYLLIKTLEGLPWYLSVGRKYPTTFGPNSRRLRPEEEPNDRIENQLMFLPSKKPTRNKTILMFNGLLYGDSRVGSEALSECPVKACYVSTNRRDAKDADAIVFRNEVELPGIQRPQEQVWVLYTLESPYHMRGPRPRPGLVNWTATYRSDSDVVVPYGKWVYYDKKITETSTPLRNFAANKTKMVAWFVSNCETPNNRLKYVRDLQRHIQVDIYGDCGDLSCPRGSMKSCLQLLSRQYKFYLAFENSNCREYITEKLFVNSLRHDVLPVVMGARPEDYRRLAPRNSYIHVEDFPSARELAEHLLELDRRDDLYNAHFRWRGTGEVVTNTHVYCRLCALLHAGFPPKWYKDLRHWWGSPGTCTRGFWRDATTYY